MATKPQQYTPSELKAIFEALNIAPSYLSRRFILKNLVGFSDELLAENIKMRDEEENANKQADRVRGYR